MKDTKQEFLARYFLKDYQDLSDSYEALLMMEETEQARVGAREFLGAIKDFIEIKPIDLDYRFRDDHEFDASMNREILKIICLHGNYAKEKIEEFINDDRLYWRLEVLVWQCQRFWNKKEYIERKSKEKLEIEKKAMEIEKLMLANEAFEKM